MFSIKHFLFGAALALLPVCSYGYIKFKPDMEVKSNFTPKTEYLSYSDISKSLKEKITPSPIVAPVKKVIISPTEPEQKMQTASYVTQRASPSPEVLGVIE